MATIGTDQQLALNLTGISKSFGGIDAVVDVNMQVAVGESRAVIGPNGAGKSTFFSLISGETVLDKGKIVIFDKDLTQKPVQQRIELGMGRTYQSSNLFMEMTVRENLFLSVWKRSKAPSGILSILFKPWFKYTDQIEQLEQAADEAGLADKLETKVLDMSHGEHRQLELAMTLAHQPKILLLDEPMAGLSDNERSFMTYLIMILRSHITILVIEHDIDIAFSLADKVSVLHQGRIIADGTPTEIRVDKKVREIYTLSTEANGQKHA
ncbi:MAG: ABC transporter ATP-binding protein [Desulfobacterales bacterium]|nr:ABC transporter ATP-binding protein [Desulfobacterales bacterium]